MKIFVRLLSGVQEMTRNLQNSVFGFTLYFLDLRCFLKFLRKRLDYFLDYYLDYFLDYFLDLRMFFWIIFWICEWTIFWIIFWIYELIFFFSKTSRKGSGGVRK